MSKKLFRFAVMTALFGAAAVSNVAFAIYEIEPNDTIATPQHLVIGSDGTVQVTGAVGALSGDLTDDLDFFTFDGREGDLVTIDIDGGIKTADSGARSVDANLTLFGPGPSFVIVTENEDSDPPPPDDGSTSTWDPRIDNYRLPASGRYTVAVSSSGRTFADGGILESTELNAWGNGSYTLLISGVTPPQVTPPPAPPPPSVVQISIEVRPGSRHRVPVNRKARANIPVALLSSAEFDPFEVDRDSLTFGVVGNEDSLVRCNSRGRDLNDDGRPDLVCLFDNEKANFEPGHSEAIVKGTVAGRQFEGKGWLKAVPAKRHHHRQRHDR